MDKYFNEIRKHFVYIGKKEKEYLKTFREEIENEFVNPTYDVLIQRYGDPKEIAAAYPISGFEQFLRSKTRLMRTLSVFVIIAVTVGLFIYVKNTAGTGFSFLNRNVEEVNNLDYSANTNEFSLKSDLYDYSIQGISVGIQDETGFVVIPKHAFRSKNEEYRFMSINIKLNNELIFSGSFSIDKEENDFIHKGLIDNRIIGFSAKNIEFKDENKMTIYVSIKRKDNKELKERFDKSWN